MPDDTDDELLAELRALVAHDDDPPTAVAQAARAAFGWRDVDTELPELLRDSAVEPAGVRGDEGPRLLTFEGADVTVEVEVATVGDRRRLVGQVVPPRAATVDVDHDDGRGQAQADGLGRFAVGGIAGGPVRLLLSFEDGRRVATEWIVM